MTILHIDCVCIIQIYILKILITDAGDRCHFERIGLTYVPPDIVLGPLLLTYDIPYLKLQKNNFTSTLFSKMNIDFVENGFVRKY